MLPPLQASPLFSRKRKKREFGATWAANISMLISPVSFPTYRDFDVQRRASQPCMHAKVGGIFGMFFSCGKMGVES